MKSEYFMILLPNDMCCSLQSFAANRVKNEKVKTEICQIKAQCSCINDGAINCTREIVSKTEPDSVPIPEAKNPRKFRIFFVLYFHNDCGSTISACLLSLLNQSAKKLP